MEALMGDIRARVLRLLRWSERYVKTDMVYLARGSFWLTLTQLSVVATGFLLSVAFANLMDPSEYGVYKYFLSVAAILSIATLPGTFTSYSQTVARGHEGDLGRMLKSKIAWGLGGSAISFALAAYYLIAGNLVLTVGFFILGVFLPFLDTFSMYDSLFQGRKRFDQGARFAVIEQIVASCAVLIVLLFHPDALVVLVSYCLAWSLTRALILLYVSKRYPVNTEYEPQALSYGKHLTLANAIPIISQYFDRLIVFHALGPASLAGLNFAVAIPDQIKSYFKNLQGLALPKLATSSAEDIRRTIGKKTFLLSLLIIVAVIAYIAVAPLFFAFLFPRYVEYILFSQVYALSVLFTGAVLPFMALQAKEDKKSLYTFNTIRSLFVIGALSFFFYLWGLWGIIAARIVSDLFTLVLGLYLVRR